MHDISDCIYAVAAGSRRISRTGMDELLFSFMWDSGFNLVMDKSRICLSDLSSIAAALAAGMGIFLFAPLEDKNKPLEEAEKKVIGKKARIIVVTELILGMVFLAVNQRAAYAVLGAVIWCGVSYLAWSVKRYTEKNGKSREDNN